MGIRRPVSLAYAADVIEQAGPAHASLLLKGGPRHANVIALSSRVSEASHYSGDNSEGHEGDALVSVSMSELLPCNSSSLFLSLICKPTQIHLSDN